MRLIDADALKEIIEEKVTFIDGDSVYKIIDLIDNAPTVETYYTKDDVLEAEKEGYERGKNERLQGEWIEKQETPASVSYHCSICNMEDLPVLPYCPWCGAKMKGGAE